MITKPFCYKFLVAAPSTAEKSRQNIHLTEQATAWEHKNKTSTRHRGKGTAKD